MRERTYQEVVTTRETTLWGKVAAQPTEKLSTWLKYAHSWRDNSVYGTSVLVRLRGKSAAAQVLPGRPPAQQRRGTARLRDQREDLGRRLGRLRGRRLQNSTVGLISARSANVAVELATAFNDQTQGRAYYQTQSIRSQQNGSEAFAAPDWTGRMKDKFDVLGLGVKHVAIPNKLDIGADLTVSRARNDVAVDNALAAAPFPTARTKLEALKLYGVYTLKDNLSIAGSYHYEHYDSHGLAARRHRAGDRLQPARSRRAAGELFVERVPRRAALPVLSARRACVRRPLRENAEPRRAFGRS